MKKINIILISLILFIGGCSSKNNVSKVDSNETKNIMKSGYSSLDMADTNQTVSADDNNTAFDNNITADSNTTSQVISDKKILELSKFEKQFINHIAYNHYTNAIKFLYAKDHKKAYEEAMKAKDIYNNEDNTKEQKIVLPYLPGFLRQSAQTPSRIYYKIYRDKNYELKRLIRKVKLLSPPIALVTFDQTSTYIDIKIKNVGDLPFDNFTVEINYEEVKTFDKIIPNQEVTFRFYTVDKVEAISFKEAYGFAPKAIEFTQESK